MRKIIAILMILVVGSGVSFTQNVHFSQFYASPVNLNASNTGYFKGSYRIGGNYKAQWPFASASQIGTYSTYSSYLDFSILGKKINDQDFAGFGLDIISDRAGDGNLATQRLYTSFAYHKGLDPFNRYVISAGFSGGVIQRSIDFSKLYFNNQWTGEGFDKTVEHNEPYREPKSIYPDFNAGLTFRAVLGGAERVKLGIGGSLSHINRPKDTFYNSGNRLGMRPQINANVDIEIGDRLELFNSAYYSFEKNSREINFGSMFALTLNDGSGYDSKSKLYLGMQYRVLDAIIPVVGYQFKNTRFLVNYDVNLSGLTTGSKGNGGLELSFVHTGVFPKSNNFNRKEHCPTF